MNLLHIHASKVVLLLLLLAIVPACSEEFLEVDIKGDLIAENVEDYNLLLDARNLYQYFSPVVFALTPEVCMLEPYNAAGNGDLEKLPAFMWSEDIYRPDEDMEIVQDLVNNLYVYNKIINEVLNSGGGTENQKLALQAEAKANRAWVNFMLINYFGKPYDLSTAASDPGFPLIIASDINQVNFARASVQEVYESILQDLNTAIPNLPPISSRLRMSREAAMALLGKVHVFMGNYGEALTELNAAIIAFEASPVESGLFDFNVTTLPGGAQGPGPFGPLLPEPLVNIENPFGRVNTNIDAFFSGELLLAPETSALYDTSDLRFRVFLAKNPNPFTPPILPPGFYRKVGNLLCNFGVNMPDLYLLRAECNARQGNLQASVDELEFFRQHRLPGEKASVPEALSQDDLLLFIMDERTREFAGLGMQWYTIRRLSTDPLFSNRTYTHRIYNPDATVKESFTLSPERLVLRFNQRLMNQNPGFENNP